MSPDHLAARRQQILDAARTCFLRNGFHATSMQDVITAAGLSVGAVYRYFPSKTELIAAIAGQVAEEIRGALADLAADDGPSLAESMARTVDLIEERAGPDGVLRLAVQVWAEALRDATLAPLVSRVYATLHASLARLAARAVEVGELPAGSDPDAVGSALFSLVIGYGLQRVLTGRPDPQRYRDGLRTLLA